MPKPMLPTGPGMSNPQPPVLTGSTTPLGTSYPTWDQGTLYDTRGGHTHTGFKALSFALQPGSSLQVRQQPGLLPSPQTHGSRHPGAGGGQCRQTGNGTGEAGRRRGAAEKFLKFSILDSWNKSHFLWSPCRVEDWLSSAAARPPPSHVPSPPASLPLSRGIRASAWESLPWGDSRGKRRGQCLPFLPRSTPEHSTSNPWNNLQGPAESVSQLFVWRTGKKE